MPSNSPTAILVAGSSQAGKSSFLNLLQQHLPKHDDHHHDNEERPEWLELDDQRLEKWIRANRAHKHILCFYLLQPTDLSSNPLKMTPSLSTLSRLFDLKHSDPHHHHHHHHHHHRHVHQHRHHMPTPPSPSSPLNNSNAFLDNASPSSRKHSTQLHIRPLLSKADCLTCTGLKHAKNHLRHFCSSTAFSNSNASSVLPSWSIISPESFDPVDVDADMDMDIEMEDKAVESPMTPNSPLELKRTSAVTSAAAAASSSSATNGKCSVTREYPWGTCDPFNPAHSDLSLVLEWAHTTVEKLQTESIPDNDSNMTDDDHSHSDCIHSPCLLPDCDDDHTGHDHSHSPRGRTTKQQVDKSDSKTTGWESLPHEEEEEEEEELSSPMIQNRISTPVIIQAPTPSRPLSLNPEDLPNGPAPPPVHSPSGRRWPGAPASTTGLPDDGYPNSHPRRGFHEELRMTGGEWRRGKKTEIVLVVQPQPQSPPGSSSSSSSPSSSKDRDRDRKKEKREKEDINSTTMTANNGVSPEQLREIVLDGFSPPRNSTSPNIQSTPPLVAPSVSFTAAAQPPPPSSSYRLQDVHKRKTKPRKPKTQLACTFCRSRKLKCAASLNGGEGCGECEKRGIPCMNGNGVPKAPPPAPEFRRRKMKTTNTAAVAAAAAAVVVPIMGPDLAHSINGHSATHLLNGLIAEPGNLAIPLGIQRYPSPSSSHHQQQVPLRPSSSPAPPATSTVAPVISGSLTTSTSRRSQQQQQHSDLVIRHNTTTAPGPESLETAKGGGVGPQSTPTPGVATQHHHNHHPPPHQYEHHPLPLVPTQSISSQRGFGQGHGRSLSLNHHHLPHQTRSPSLPPRDRYPSQPTVPTRYVMEGTREDDRRRERRERDREYDIERERERERERDRERGQEEYHHSRHPHHQRERRRYSYSALPPDQPPLPSPSSLLEETAPPPPHYVQSQSYPPRRHPSPSLQPPSSQYRRPHSPASSVGTADEALYMQQQQQHPYHEMPPPPFMVSSQQQPARVAGYPPPMTSTSGLGMKRKAGGEEVILKPYKAASSRSGPKVVACQYCRARKTRCDGDSPCSNCRKRNLHCEYQVSSREAARRKRAAQAQRTTEVAAVGDESGVHALDASTIPPRGRPSTAVHQPQQPSPTHSLSGRNELPPLQQPYRDTSRERLPSLSASSGPSPRLPSITNLISPTTPPMLLKPASLTHSRPSSRDENVSATSSVAGDPELSGDFAHVEPERPQSKRMRLDELVNATTPSP